MPLRLCRFGTNDGNARVGLVDNEDGVRDLTAAGALRLQDILESGDPVTTANRLAAAAPPAQPLSGLRLLAPVDRQEVWAAGVTYLRSKVARMEESDFSATA